MIGVRSFGDTADGVARHGAAWIRGLQSTGVAATAKHFPGHGDTALDSHLALPVIDRSPASSASASWCRSSRRSRRAYGW